MKSLRKRKMFKLYAQQYGFRVKYERFKYAYPNPEHGKTLGTQYTIYNDGDILMAYLILENTTDEFQRLYNRYKKDIKRCRDDV